MTWVFFAILLAACCAAGATGMLFSPGAWYEGLRKPRWTPPNWAFPVAWTTLYICMSAAGALAASAGSTLALALWALQIVLNALWTPLFFGLHRIRPGFFVICALWVTVLAALVVHWSVVPLAGILFVPYLAWVTIAAGLNAAIWRLNPGEITSGAAG